MKNIETKLFTKKQMEKLFQTFNNELENKAKALANIADDASVEEMLSFAEKAIHNSGILTEDTHTKELALARWAYMAGAAAVVAVQKEMQEAFIGTAFDTDDDVVFTPESLDCDFALTNKGDSLINVRIFDGDIVYFICPDEMRNGDIAAISYNDETIVRRIYYSEDKSKLTLVACNPLYPDMAFFDDDIHKIHVLGKAVGFSSKL